MVMEKLKKVNVAKVTILGEKMVMNDKYLVIKWYSLKGKTDAGGGRYSVFDDELQVIADLGCIIPTALKTPKGEPSST